MDNQHKHINNFSFVKSTLGKMGDHKMSAQKLISKIAVTSTLALMSLTNIAGAAEVAEGVRISPSSADTYFGSATTATDGLSGKRSETTPYALVSLARSLGSDRTTDITAAEYRTRVFEYVRDNIKTLPYYGVKKGALGAYYDNEGTSFDQAMLMVELIEQRSGLTADYKIGTVALTSTQWADLFNVTDAEAACQMLTNGGIPATVNSSNPCTSLTGSVTSVTMSQAWVYSGSTTYNPSYKKHTMEAGIDIADAMVVSGSYSESSFWTDASTDITTGTVNEITGSDISTIESDLETYAGNLVTQFKDTDYQKSLDQITGGRYVDPADLGNLSYGTLTTQRTVSGDMPNQYRTSLNIDYGTINKTLYADELYGLRLWMDALDLMVGNEVVATSSSSDTEMILTVNHPYAANSGAYGDHSVTITASDLDSAAIVFATGSGSHQASRHIVNDSYQNSIVNDTTAPATETMARMSLGASWAVQYGQLMELDAALGDTTYQHHDTVGVIISDSSDNITPHLYSNISVNADSGTDADRVSSIQTLNTMSGVLQSALIDQGRDTGSDDIRSAASMFAEAIADGDKNILEFTQSNRTNITTDASHYDSGLRTTLIAELAANANLVVLMVDSFTGLDGNANAEPFIRYDTSGAGTFDQQIGETASSYGTATEIGTAGDLLGGNAGDIIRDNSPQSVSGEYGDSATDIVTGAGSFPMSLPFTRSFQISRIDAPNKGWMHNYDITARVTSNPLLALSNPVAASQMIASLHVLREMYDARQTSYNAQAVVTGALVANWMRNELVDNTVTIRTAGGSDFYYKLADGTYEALSGSLAALTYVGSTTDEYTVTALSDSEMIFENVATGDYRIKQMTWPNGLDVDFTYTSNTLTVANNVDRSLLITDLLTDGTFNLVQDNVGRRVDYDYNGTTGFMENVEIKAVATPATTDYGTAVNAIADFDLTANATTKGWDVKVYLPTNIITPVVTHSINRLGQIVESENIDSESGLYYPSQRRGETVAATGAMSTTYTNHQGLTYKAVNALGDESSSTFYGNGLLKRATSNVGNAVEYDYNKYGQKTTATIYPNNGSGGTDITDSLVTTYSYNTLANKLTIASITTPDLDGAVANDNVTTYEYFTTGAYDDYLKKVIQPNVDVWNTGTSANVKERPETVYAYTTVTTLGSDVITVLDTVTAPDGTVTKNSYFADEALVQKVTQDYHATPASGLNVDTSYTYDGLGNRLTGESHAENEKRTVFNVRRQVEETSLYDYLGQAVVWSGSYGSLTTVTKSYGTVEQSFDAAGRTTKVRTYYGGGVNDYQDHDVTYDTLGRVSTKADEAADTTTYNYTPVLGTTITVTAPTGYDNATGYSMAEVEQDITVSTTRKVRAYTDILGRTIRTVIAPGTAAEITEERGYNDAGQLGWVRDGNNNVTKYTYDTYGRSKRTTYPDTSWTEASSYDDRGQPGTLTKRDGSTFTLTYDAHGRIQKRVVKNSSAVLERTYDFGFDNMGRTIMAEVTKGASVDTITMTYDALGRKTDETGDDGYGTSYVYTDDDNEVEITYDDPGSDTYKITQIMNFRGQIAGIVEKRNADPDKVLAGFDYDEMGRMTKAKTGANRVITYAYENDGDLDYVENELSSALSKVKYDYGYNDAGQVTSKDITSALYQWSPAEDIEYDYPTADINEMNQPEKERYSTNGGTSYSTPATITWDNNGNMTSRGTRDLTWSVENYLEQVEESSVSIATYKYDAMGRRVEKVATTTTKYIMAGGNVVAEYSGSTLLRRYVYGPGVDRPIAMITPNGSNIDREYYHYDGQGSVIATVDDDSFVTGSYAYDVFGKTDDINGASGNVYRYTGRRLDAETGYYYYRARYYDPDIGRFLSSDPIGYGDGLNMYAYVGNDPVNLVDPSGMDADCRICGGGPSGVLSNTGTLGVLNYGSNGHVDAFNNWKHSVNVRQALRVFNNLISNIADGQYNDADGNFMIEAGSNYGALVVASALQQEFGERGFNVGIDAYDSFETYAAYNPGAGITLAGGQRAPRGRASRMPRFGSNGRGLVEYFETNGGHLYRLHIGRTQQQLRSRLSNQKRLYAASSFFTPSHAKMALREALSSNTNAINSWLSNGAYGTLNISAQTNSPMGRVLYRNSKRATYSNDATFVLMYNQNSAAGFSVLTGMLN